MPGTCFDDVTNLSVLVFGRRFSLFKPQAFIDVLPHVSQLFGLLGLKCESTRAAGGRQHPQGVRTKNFFLANVSKGEIEHQPLPLSMSHRSCRWGPCHCLAIFPIRFIQTMFVPTKVIQDC